MALQFTVTAPKGIIGLLRAELATLGIKAGAQGPAALLFEGELADAYRVCLWSRLANRVLMPIEERKVSGPEDLYDFVRDIDWAEHMSVDETLAVDCTASGSVLPHSQYAALKVKDAVCDQFREREDARPSVDTQQPDIQLNLHVRSARARLSLDLAGTSLHRRGYRRDTGPAPLKENLAAALLMLSQWPELAQKGLPLFDPMCGSGTLLIEAALIASDTAPGLLREHFGFLHWHGHDQPAWDALLAEAEQRRSAGRRRLPSIVGADISAKVLADARANIGRAGFTDAIRVQQHDLHAGIDAPAGDGGLMITNAPYGQRIGAEQDLPGLYAAFGAAIRQLPGWQAALFTADPELAAQLGFPAIASHTLYNGTLECRLFQYQGSGLGEAATMFANRLRKNLKHLSRWARRESVQAFRVYDRDLPEFAFAVDSFEFETPDGPQHWAHVQEYQAPSKIDAEQAELRRLAGVGAVAEALGLPRERVILKQRARQRGKDQYQRMGSHGTFHKLREGQALLQVNLTDYLDTGLFLDHRPVRALLGAKAGGKRFLNLFCYTATATVQAALGGASSSVSVDLSKTYLAWAERNLRLNGIDQERHRLERADCMVWLDEQAAGEERFDLIFMDPPTFSNSKRMDDTLDIQRDHIGLIQAATKLLNAGGELIFSTNQRRFKLDHEALSGLELHEITRKTIPEDFKRHANIHQCWQIRPAGQ